MKNKNKNKNIKLVKNIWNPAVLISSINILLKDHNLRIKFKSSLEDKKWGEIEIKTTSNCYYD